LSGGEEGISGEGGIQKKGEKIVGGRVNYRTKERGGGKGRSELCKPSRKQGGFKEECRKKRGSDKLAADKPPTG